MKDFYRFAIYLFGALLGALGLLTVGTALTHAVEKLSVGAFFGVVVVVVFQGIIFAIAWIFAGRSLRMRSREQRGIMLLLGLLFVQLIFYVLVELRPS